MPRPKPHQLVLATVVVAGAVFAGSGVAPAIVDWHDESPISREVFGNIPTLVKTLFYLAVAVTAVVVGKLASDRVKNWERGQPDDRRTTKANAKRRAEDFRAGVWMQTLLRDPPPGSCTR